MLGKRLIAGILAAAITVTSVIMPGYSEPAEIAKAEAQSSIVYPFDYTDEDVFVSECLLGDVVIGGECPFQDFSENPLEFEYIYKIIAEEILDREWLVGGSVVWKTASDLIDGKFTEVFDWRQVMYEVLVMDWLMYQYESDEHKSEFEKDSSKLYWDILENFIDDDIIKCEMDLLRLDVAQTVTEIKAAVNKDSQSSRKEELLDLISDLDDVAGDSISAMKYAGKLLALNQCLESRIDFLKQVRQQTKDAYLQKAIDRIIFNLDYSFVSITINDIKTMFIDNLISDAWGVLSKSYPALAAIKLGKAGLDWLFNSSDTTTKRLELVFTYIINTEFEKSYKTLKTNYTKSRTHKNAVVLNGAYKSLCSYGAYASYICSQYTAEVLLEGYFNKIVSAFTDVRIERYNQLKDCLDSNIFTSKRREALLEMYKDMYYNNLKNQNPGIFSSGEVGTKFTVDGLEYEVINPGEVEVDGYSKIGDSLKIPSDVTYDNCAYRVVGIGNRAFEDCTSLTSVVIPDSVTSIGGYAFYNCTSLISVIVPNSITRISYSAFEGCTSLTLINIPDSVTSIDSGAFMGCTSLTSITIPDSVKYIGWDAFYDCTSLVSVNIPDSVTQIGARAFFNTGILNNQTDVFRYVGKWLVQVNYGTSAVIKDGTVGIADLAFSRWSHGYNTWWHNEALKSVTIPDSVKIIGSGAFEKCTSLTSINIPNSVTIIGRDAFYDCTSLTSINIPDSVTVIGGQAFSHCTSLTSINIPDSVTSIGEYAFYNTPILNNQTGNLKYIGKWLIEATGRITSAEIKEGTVGIAGGAFQNCNDIKSVTIPNSVTIICYIAFQGCDVLESVNIPDSVTRIEPYAFYTCRSLKSVTIPKSVTSIGDGAFGYIGWSIDNGPIRDFKISCYKFTAGEQYAKDNGFEYILIDQPKMVSGFKAISVTDTYLQLMWKKSRNATGYIIQQYKGNKWVRIAKITDSNTNIYTVTGLTPSSRNVFRIQAYKNITGGAEKTKFTDKLVVYTNPKKVTGFKSTSKTNNSVTLKWDKNSTATGYIIERYIQNRWARVAKIENNATTSYTVKNLIAASRCTFRIQAYKNINNGAKKSAYTDKLVVYTNPKPMEGFKASDKTKNTITLSWTKNVTATGYIIEQYKNNKWVRIAKIERNSTTTYKLYNLKANTRYAFRIQGYTNIPSGAVKTKFTDKLVVYTNK